MLTLHKPRTALNTAPEPPNTISDWLAIQEEEHREFGHLFTDRREFEYFVMLPLTKTQRLTVLAVMQEEAKVDNALRQELLRCNGSTECGPVHRSQCLKCIYTKRPDCAKSYY
jgi:hypothetical protein